MTVVLGGHIKNGTKVIGEVKRVAEAINYPHYDSVSYDNDISLLRLLSPVEFNDDISPVCLAEAGSRIHHNTSSWVTGWGETFNGKLNKNICILLYS